MPQRFQHFGAPSSKLELAKQNKRGGSIVSTNHV